jgi:protoheme IX farnesyltransferase
MPGSLPIRSEGRTPYQIEGYPPLTLPSSLALADTRRSSVRELAAAYLSLTKPRVISLLLLTTLGAMLAAASGMPPLGLILATMLGGAMSAGAANTINCYLDRDIDGLMERTRERRALPSGRLEPMQALRFGLLLAVLSFVEMALLVNLLAAVLAQIALLFYVFVYTGWLKRSTPSNIVIGGAAGAVPPLVGWAAVTGELGLLAWYLFAIVFFWTPPHFWALALLIKREYGQARIPMLPLVRGDAETRHQILLYSVLLVTLTLVMVPFGLVGSIYLAAALPLGALFILYALRLSSEADHVAASRLFRYSILYLALLFTAVVVDRQILL